MVSCLIYLKQPSFFAQGTPVKLEELGGDVAFKLLRFPQKSATQECAPPIKFTKNSNKCWYDWNKHNEMN